MISGHKITFAARNVAVVLIATASLASAEAADLSVDEITVAYGPIPDVQMMAHAKGWFEEELSIPINWITLSGGAASIAAMQSGSLDMACGVGTPPIAAATAQGVPLRIFWIQDDAAEPLAVNPAVAKSVAELEGARLAVLVGSTMYFALAVALEQEGIALRDVQIIDLPVEETVTAYRRGDIDGSILPHPMIDALISEGAVEIMSPKQRTEDYGYSLFDACVVLADFAEQHPDVLERWVAVEERAVQHVRSDPEDAYQTLADALDITPEVAKTGLEAAAHPSAEEQLEAHWLGKPGATGSGVAKAIEITAQFQLDMGRIPAVPENIDQHIDSSFVAKVVSE